MSTRLDLDMPALDLVEVLVGAGAPRELFDVPVTWFIVDGVYHGSCLCAGKALHQDYPYRLVLKPEEFQGETESISLFSLSPDLMCPECDRHSLLGVGSDYHAARMLLLAQREVEKPLPTSIEEVLKERETSEYAWMPLNMVRENENLAHLFPPLAEALRERERKREALFHSTDLTEALLRECREALNESDPDDKPGSMIVKGNVYPLTGGLYAALVERFRVAAVNPESDETFDERVADPALRKVPTYVVQGPTYVLQYLERNASWRKVLRGAGPVLHSDPQVVQTAVSLWSSAEDGMFKSLDQALEVAGIL